MSAYHQLDRPEVRAMIPLECKTILDVGCGEGRMGKALKRERPGVSVFGIESEWDSAVAARKVLDGTFCVDAERWEGWNALKDWARPPFDCMVFSDVLEHFKSPELVLARFVDHALKPDGFVVASIPNFRCLETLEHFFKGEWAPRDCGLLDRGHLHFFCLSDMIRLFEGAGLKIVEVRALSVYGPDLYPESCRESSGNTQPPTRHDVFFRPIQVYGIPQEDWIDMRVVQYGVIGRKEGEPNAQG